MEESAGNELIRELCSIERRGPGTDAERRAANALAARVRALGRRVEVEPTYVHPQYALVHALHGVVAIAGSIAAVAEPAIGFGLVLTAATSTYLDLNTRFYLARRLFFRRASQNVVSPGSNPEAPLRVILAAHYDAGRSGYVFSRSLRLGGRMSERGRLFLAPWRLFFWAGIAPLLPILGARMAGLDAPWLSLLQLLPTTALIVSVFLLIDIALSEIVPGAYDDASGVAAATAAAARLGADPPPNVDLWLLLTGAGETTAEGMRAWIRANRKRLDRERTVVVNVGPVSHGTVNYTTAEGAVISIPMDAELAELCEALATAGGEGGGASPVRLPSVTEATAARAGGLRAISILGLDDGLPAPWLHSPDDTPERVNAAALERATEFVVSLVRLLDRGAGRR